jgi:hypothetical protein
MPELEKQSLAESLGMDELIQVYVLASAKRRLKGLVHLASDPGLHLGRVSQGKIVSLAILHLADAVNGDPRKLAKLLKGVLWDDTPGLGVPVVNDEVKPGPSARQKKRGNK